MKQKIEWYREVLEIEPNSKIFFPLARMLAKDGRGNEAIAVLRQGVGRHPDHVEARLFLVEQLYLAGRAVELHQEISVLSDLFKVYPNFWRAWGERLFEDEETRDAGLAAIFMAAFLQNMPVSWAGVIEHGLKSLISGDAVRPTAVATEAHPLSSRPVAPAAPAASVVPAPAPEPLPEPEPVAFDDEEEPVSDEDTAPDEEDDEPISLRTRSMADVLASQGDIAGALDIYEELLKSVPEAEKTELRTKIQTLSGKAAGTGEGESGAADEGGREEKKDWLSVLAQRLEARSLQ